ncbi:MAG: dTDP-4-dehydrorhamnose reductase [Bacteroidia bacterium]|nr:dTDP-4-dehydrorhamnose reductase [Bacteroidia bacterium]NNF31511.1 dTDP-4-dehydrorhamnose reductase [Flavobacteriaceae bacterium]MBT8275586.1 dTDP-4-dehydrorhamnose reductase [Bacteroidia bacterium]NNJ82776.1 dTDP-4-dehydrorhamnose reductase [Flavobacteriaceae bacterium]NNK54090.1 dTDP-4-dehydrorhamnose reductase [Flavobacteriaceae bacterium]
MKQILVTGANGQLAKCIKDAANNYSGMELHFVTRKELDISNAAAVSVWFENKSFDYCINTAAYTNVEKAESEKDAAFATNAEGVKNVANACKKYGITLIHISTDYVFDGNKTSPYSEEDKTNPINVYGASKLKGEENITASGCKHLIMRTSWLYSQYGHNFFNTVLRFASEGKPLTVTTEQTGVPTNANDLADAILKIVMGNAEAHGIFHFSNRGNATWYDFAEAILEFTGQLAGAKLAKTNHYRTFAKRPKYSILNTKRFSEAFGIVPLPWRESLKELVKINLTKKRN